MSEEQNNFNKKLGTALMTGSALGSLFAPSEALVPKDYQNSLIAESDLEQSMPEYKKYQENQVIESNNTQQDSYRPAFLGGMTKEDQLGEAHTQNFENQTEKNKKYQESRMKSPRESSLDVDPLNPHKKYRNPSKEKSDKYKPLSEEKPNNNKESNNDIAKNFQGNNNHAQENDQTDSNKGDSLKRKPEPYNNHKLIHQLNENHKFQNSEYNALSKEKSEASSRGSP